MNYRMLIAPLVAAATIGLGACSSPTLDNPTASNTTTATQPDSGSASSSDSSHADPLANTDPCSLITASEVASNGWQPGKTTNAPGGRACLWERPDDGANNDGYNVGIVIYDTAGLDQLNTTGGTVSDNSVGKYQGKVFQDPPLNECVASIGITSKSRIDIDVNSRLGMTTGCTLAKQVSGAVVSHLPAGS